jgi:hypothetical protein
VGRMGLVDITKSCGKLGARSSMYALLADFRA